jgi:hypothetical protein
MSIKTKFALSAVIVLSTVATASAATKKQKIAVHRSGPHVQAIVPRTAPLSTCTVPQPQAVVALATIKASLPGGKASSRRQFIPQAARLWLPGGLVAS